MAQDNHNQTNLSENKIIEQLDEQALQAVNGGCQGCEAMHSLADMGMQRSNKLVGKASSTYNAGRASDLADSFKSLKIHAGSDISMDATRCCNYQSHFDSYQILKERYSDIQSAIKQEKKNS